jgi:F-type H+-transporting ATPase subunit alpha
MKKVAGKLRLELAQYRELAAFAQFASDLDKNTRDQLTRGERLVELLKQDQFGPLAFEQQVMSIYAGTSGALDDLPTDRVREFEKGFLAHMAARHPGVAEKIRQSRKFEPDTEAALKGAIAEFKAAFAPKQGAEAKKEPEAKKPAEAAAK